MSHVVLKANIYCIKSVRLAARRGFTTQCKSMCFNSAQFYRSFLVRLPNQVPATTSPMDQDRTWNLFALKLAGKASPEEWAELQQIMEQEPQIAVHLQTLTNFWHQHSKYDKERIEKAIKKIAGNHAVLHDLSAPLREKVKQNNPVAKKKNHQGVLTIIKKQLKYFIHLFVKNIPI